MKKLRERYNDLLRESLMSFNELALTEDLILDNEEDISNYGAESFTFIHPFSGESIDCNILKILKNKTIIAVSVDTDDIHEINFSDIELYSAIEILILIENNEM